MTMMQTFAQPDQLDLTVIAEFTSSSLSSCTLKCRILDWALRSVTGLSLQRWRADGGAVDGEVSPGRVQNKPRRLCPGEDVLVR